MKEQFVTYEIALKLKELRFDECCLAVYFKNKFQLVKGFNINNVDLHMANEMDAILAPLWQQVIDFFREKYNIQIEILWRGDMNAFNYKIGTFQYGTYIFSDKDWKFEEYYEAREQAILKAIELIKK